MSQSKDSRDSKESLSFSVGQVIQVRIEKMAVGGAAIARHQGVVIFVQGGAPGELAEIKIIHKKKNFLEGEIISIVEPSPFRRTAPCPVAGKCGGCAWQHLKEEEQLRQKELIVKENFKKFLPEVSYELLPIVKSPKDFRYRNRIQPKTKNGKFGFFGHGSHEIVEAKDCLITEESIATKLPQIASEAVAKRPDGRLEAYIDQDTNEVRWNFIDEDEDGVGFSQVNRFQNEFMVNTALDWSMGEYSEVWDLYAGAGNFTHPLTSKYPSLNTFGVELSAKLVERGRRLSKNKKTQFFQADVESFLKRRVPAKDSLVFLDPPRAGCTQYVMESIALAMPKKIVYISCHPTSLVRDLQWFFQAAQKKSIKYRLRRVQPFDMFPQTDHVETLVELEIDS